MEVLSLNKIHDPEPWLCICFVSTPGIRVDDLIMQLVGLRYTESDMTVSYPGFLYLLMKMESMIRKGGRCGRQRERVTVMDYLFCFHVMI